MLVGGARACWARSTVAAPWGARQSGGGAAVRFDVVDGGGERTSVTAPAGTSLLAALQAADLAVDAPCGGAMACGVCRVMLQAPGREGQQAAWTRPQSAKEQAALARGSAAKPLAAGTRLACATTLTKNMQDMTVVLPPSS